MTSTALKDLAANGVSIWLDDLSRERLTSGNLQQLIDTKGVVGVTTNPSIFQAALSEGHAYDAQVRELADAGKTVDEAVFALTTQDVRDACDLFLPVYEATGGQDGRVSIEVDPRLAHDTARTIEEAKALAAAVDRPNVLIKIPATVEGLPAITEVMGAGISVNVTLIFALDRYRAVMNAFLAGLEKARASDADLSGLHSVASFFVSRVDTEVDARLDELGTDEAKALRGKAAVANARLAYQAYEEVFSTPRWQTLKDDGAHAAAPAVGLHRRQGPGLPRHDVRHRAGRARHRQHHAGEDPRRHRRPRRGLRRHRDALLRRGGRGARQPRAPGHLLRRGHRQARARGRRQVREVLGRAARRGHQRAREGHGVSTLDVAATGAAADAVAAHVPTLVADRVASRLFAKDHTLWGEAAEAESAKRLSWTGLPRTSRHLVGEVAALRDELAETGYDRVVLCGMGGSSLAPEVICATAGVPIVVLDSSDPDVVRGALTDLDRTVVVVSSKSGSTVETDSQRRAFAQAFTDAGIDPTTRIVIVTDPGSPLDGDARAAGFRVVNADPDVGGRYSALTAFGLVPSGLAGADIEALLDDAEAVADLLAADDDANPALRLAAAMAGTEPLRDKLVLVDDGTENVGFGAWAEQLIAESTGKDGTGILPGRRHRHRAGPPLRRRHRRAPRRLRRRHRPDGCRVVGHRGIPGQRRRPAGRPADALGGRHGRRRPAARHQPVRPARRRERQVGGPRAARRRHRRR